MNRQKRPLRIFYELVSNDGCRYRLGYDDNTDLYQFSLAGFSNMMVSMPLLELSKLAYQLELSYLDEDGSRAPVFLDKTNLLKELENEQQTCEVVDIINNEVLIYLPGKEIHDGYFIRKADKVSISEKELTDDGTFFIGAFIPDYLLCGATEPGNIIRQENEEAFKSGYLTAVSRFENFIFTQRQKFNEPGKLDEAMANVKGAMVD